LGSVGARHFEFRRVPSRGGGGGNFSAPEASSRIAEKRTRCRTRAAANCHGASEGARRDLTIVSIRARARACAIRELSGHRAVRRASALPDNTYAIAWRGVDEPRNLRFFSENATRPRRIVVPNSFSLRGIARSDAAWSATKQRHSRGARGQRSSPTGDDWPKLCGFFRGGAPPRRTPTIVSVHARSANPLPSPRHRIVQRAAAPPATLGHSRGAAPLGCFSPEGCFASWPRTGKFCGFCRGATRPRRNAPADSVGPAPECTRRIRLSPGLARRRGIGGVRAASSATRSTDRFFGRRLRGRANRRRRGFGHRVFSKLQEFGATWSDSAASEGRARTTWRRVALVHQNSWPATPRQLAKQPSGEKQSCGALPSEKKCVRRDHAVTLGAVYRPAKQPNGRASAPRWAASLAITQQHFRRSGSRAQLPKAGAGENTRPRFLVGGRVGHEKFPRIRVGRGTRAARKSFRVPEVRRRPKKFSSGSSRVGVGHTSQPEKFRRPMSERRPDRKVAAVCRDAPPPAAAFPANSTPPTPPRRRLPEFRDRVFAGGARCRRFSLH
jgi:hypothetical protein